MSQFSQSESLLNNNFTASKYTAYSSFNFKLVGVFDPNAGDVYVVDYACWRAGGHYQLNK